MELNYQKVKLSNILAFPKNKRVKLFWVIISTEQTEFVATNERTKDSTDVVQEVCGIRWKIEEFHTQLKQLTGIESFQCRQARIQTNQIGAGMLVWLRLKNLAYETGQTIYQLNRGLLSNYLIQQLKRPTITIFLV